jgi:hypothetical protein
MLVEITNILAFYHMPFAGFADTFIAKDRLDQGCFAAAVIALYSDATAIRDLTAKILKASFVGKRKI